MRDTVLENICKECERIEEDAIHSGKAHHNAASLWSSVHYLIGIPMTIFAAWAGIDAFSADPTWSGHLALGTATLAALQTFLGASDKAAKHSNAGCGYFTLKNQVRFLKEIELSDIEKAEAVQKIRAFTKERDELNNISPAIPYFAFWFARKSVDGGSATYRADKEG